MWWRRKWPDIAEKLIRVKFDHSLRELDVAANMSSELPRQVGIHWETALNQAVEDTAQSLSETWKQALFNAPGLLLMAYVCIHVVITFLVGKLPSRGLLQARVGRHTLSLGDSIYRLPVLGAARVWTNIDGTRNCKPFASKQGIEEPRCRTNRCRQRNSGTQLLKPTH